MARAPITPTSQGKLLWSDVLKAEQPSGNAAKAVDDHQRSPESDASCEHEQINRIAVKTKTNPTDKSDANEAQANKYQPYRLKHRKVLATDQKHSVDGACREKFWRTLKTVSRTIRFVIHLQAQPGPSLQSSAV